MENTGCKTCPGLYGNIEIDPTETACAIASRGREERSNCGGGRPAPTSTSRSRDGGGRGGRGGGGQQTFASRQPVPQTRIVTPSMNPSTPVRTPAPEQITGKGDGVPATAKQPVPPPAPKPVAQAAVTDTPTITSTITAPIPASTANGGKGLVPGSPEYCAQFPETELCRQGKAPPPPSPATPIYCGDPGAHPELCTPRPVNAAPPPAPAPTSAIVSKGAPSAASSETVKAAGSVSGTLDECLADFANMTPERQIATIQASGPLGTYTTSSEAIVGIRAGRNGAAASFANFMRTFRMGSPEITAFCAAVNRAIAPSGRVDSTGFTIGQSASVAPWDARYSIPSSMMPAGQPGGCIAPPAPAGAAVQHGSQWWNNNGYPEQIPGFAAAGSVLGYNPMWWTQQGLPEQIPGFAPAGAALDHDGYLDVFVQLPAEAQANVLTSLAFGQGEVRDPYAHFLAGLLRRGELMFNGEPVAELAVSHIKNFANRAQAPSARGLIDLAIMQEGTSYGFVPPSNNGFAPAGNAAPQANQPPPGFTPEQWGALLAQNPEVAARLWTEFQQRPSTFSQVSGSIMQAANVVLSQLNASRAAALEERRADFAHQQAMARIQIDRENAAAQRLATTAAPAIDPGAVAAQIAAITAAQQPQQQPADTSGMSTGAMAALGLGVVAIGGGGLYLVTRKGGSRSARSNGFLDGLFGKSKGGKKPTKKAR